MTLNFTLTKLKGGMWRINDAMGQWNWDFSIGGVSLIDPVNAKRYRPGRTHDDGTEQNNRTCLCSSTRNMTISEGQTVPFYATFAAPPPDVTEVNIEIPHVGTITDVPIS